MTDISPTPHAAAALPAPELVACAHCGHMDSGTYCSACGKELVEDEHRTVAHDVWEMLVVDRLNDAREYLTTTWHMVAHPLRFFATVLARPATRARHVFPEPAPQALPRGLAQRPVTYYALSFVTSILLGKILGVQTGQLIAGLDDDFNNELVLLLAVATFAIYSMVFRWTSGRRISTEEVAIISAYTTGFSAVLTTLSTAFPPLAPAISLLALYVIFGIPLTVMRRLYGMSRRRVLLAQLVAGVGVLALAILLLTVLMVLRVPLAS
ncbi:hypothetical protein [Longimicrobium sp.]|uniref:hypothetical protein n=1 Tax=Longimicrobium sp. TaxID=2029185 RepID=UPI002E34CE01|nr:hypothetical protein [Longimicrobium sp.]HEX6037159.1 hypothetical protein [Longimicrobium sp.]